MLTISDLHDRLRRREISAAELVDEHLEVIGREEPRLHAFLRTTEELARGQAAEADRKFAAGDGAGPLTGIPAAIKDVLCVEDVETTAGSRILAGDRPPYDSTAVARLRAQGSAFLGMTNCDEFAMGSSTENSGYYPTGNPHDPTRVPGGSSGGSAAAVAAGEAVYALGTDTGGSIRQPAALCGVVGMKPTYGRVSRYGLIAFASSLDQIGPFARSVDDAAITLSLMGGFDPLDATSSDRPGLEVLNNSSGGVKGMRLGVPREYYDLKGIEPGVKAAIDAALFILRNAGAEIVDVSLPHTDYGLAAYYIIAPAECSSNLARFDGVRYGLAEVDAANITDEYLQTRRKGFGTEVRRRVMLR